MPTADNEVVFELSGPGRILGLDNGQAESHESTRETGARLSAAARWRWCNPPGSQARCGSLLRPRRWPAHRSPHGGGSYALRAGLLQKLDCVSVPQAGRNRCEVVRLLADLKAQRLHHQRLACHMQRQACKLPVVLANIGLFQQYGSALVQLAEYPRSEINVRNEVTLQPGQPVPALNRSTPRLQHRAAGPPPCWVE